MLLTGEDLSVILGWSSIACWITVYSPQILENFRLKSGDGLSTAFVYIWLFGDLTNLVGAAMAGLLPTVIVLAVYYSACDIILLFQIYYYRWANKQDPTRINPPRGFESDQLAEETPLLLGQNNEHEATQKKTSTRRLVAQYSAAVLFIIIAGVVAWINTRKDKPDDAPKQPEVVLEWKTQVLGYASAASYLGARVPQIVKNFQTRCAGLSPALFFFAILGNSTYALSIIAASQERDYLIINASWLAGSALTVFLDITVLCQFMYYRSVGGTSPATV